MDPGPEVPAIRVEARLKLGFGANHGYLRTRQWASQMFRRSDVERNVAIQYRLSTDQETGANAGLDERPFGGADALMAPIPGDRTELIGMPSGLILREADPTAALSSLKKDSTDAS